APQTCADGVLDRGGLREAALAPHRMDQLARDGHVERSPVPRDELDRRELRAELEHQRLREVQRLWLVPAFGAVGDADLDRAGHLRRDARDQLPQLADHFLVREGRGLVTHLRELGLELRPHVLGQLVHRGVRRAELGVCGEDLATSLRAQVRDRCRPLDPVAELAEVVVVEDDDRDRLERALVEPALHQVVVLVAQEHADVELPARLREPADDRKVRDDVAAPVLGEDNDMERAWKLLEGGDVVRAQLDAPLVLLETLAVAGHLPLVGVEREPLREARTIHGHSGLPAVHAGTARHNARAAGVLPLAPAARAALRGLAALLSHAGHVPSGLRALGRGLWLLRLAFGRAGLVPGGGGDALRGLFRSSPLLLALFHVFVLPLPFGTPGLPWHVCTSRSSQGRAPRTPAVRASCVRATEQDGRRADPRRRPCTGPPPRARGRLAARQRSGPARRERSSRARQAGASPRRG